MNIKDVQSKEDNRLVAFFLETAVLILLGMGTVFVFSAQSRVNSAITIDTFLRSQAGKHLIFAIISVLIISILQKVHYNKLRRVAIPLLIISFISLASVYTPIGVEINGARRWIKIADLTFQPSELVKIALVIFLASKLTEDNFDIRSFWKGFFPIATICGIYIGLIGREDFGTAALIAAISAIMLITAGAKLLHIILLSIPAIAGFGYLIITNPYRLERIYSFLDIWKDPQDSGYHAIQSLIGIANGGWFGVGLGSGLQKYGYLPEDTTDFIFSIICEELGFVGGVLIILIMITITFIGIRTYRKMQDPFGKLLIAGFFTSISLQAAINIAVATVSIPTKGIALPFVSAGGSGLLALSSAVAICCNIIKEK